MTINDIISYCLPIDVALTSYSKLLEEYAKPIIHKFKVREFRNSTNDGLYDGHIDTGANTLCMNTEYESLQSERYCEKRQRESKEKAEAWPISSNQSASPKNTAHSAQTQKNF